MPKPNLKMNSREQAICARVREFRKALKWSQPDFAEALGITIDQLKSVEYARTPLSFDLGSKLCERFDVSQRWLATGEGRHQPHFNLAGSMVAGADKKRAFSAVYEQLLANKIEERLDDIARLVGHKAARSGQYETAILNNFHDIGASDAQAMVFYLKKLISMRLEWLPDDLLLEYGKALFEADEQFQESNRKQLLKCPPPAARLTAMGLSVESRTDLTETSGVVKPSGVKPQWPGLKRRLQKATTELGAKSTLAKVLGVDPTQISQWLSDAKSAREPGAEYALQMLHWVQLQERKT